MEDSIIKSFKLQTSPDKAFKAFVENFFYWWPQEYTWSQDVLEEIRIEPREGGRCYEKGPFNFHNDWGRVLIYNPPNRIVFTWQISPIRIPQPNPVKSSEVDIKFIPENDETWIEFEHRNFNRHGDGADKYREAMESSQGWEYILECYAKFVEKSFSAK